MISQFWGSKIVLITGHTGFKGSWLSLLLDSLGAKVHGYALRPVASPNMFDQLGIAARISNEYGDVRDPENLSATILRVRPDIIIHLAAQPLVRYGYSHPVETYSTNVMGVVNLFEAVRSVDSVRVVLNVTTDKVYENCEWIWGYRESDRLGGVDPYSSSKACAELVTAAYREAYLVKHNVQVATARAGNVIGGGDWSEDRLIPDLYRAIKSGKKIYIRNPDAVRPWQHVLDPLWGYLRLAAALYTADDDLCGGWNFGPLEYDTYKVEWIVESFLAAWEQSPGWEIDANESHPKESQALKLDSSKARAFLGWEPLWSLEQALQVTVAWYQGYMAGQDLYELTMAQIHAFQSESNGESGGKKE